jgi:hypothetical protein
MILGRLRRARRLSALVIVLCTLFAAVSARESGVMGERQVHEPVAAAVGMLSAARSAAVEVARSAHSHDRSPAGFFLAPHDAHDVVICKARCDSLAPASLETLAASRPRRLAFRYEATAPPSAL